MWRSRSPPRRLACVSPQPASSGGYEVLSGGELLAFGAAAATGTYTADLTYLERGLYGTQAAAQAAGAQFTLFDTSSALGTMLKLPLESAYIGKTIYFKFQSYNVFGNAAEDISTLTTYAFTPGGSAFGSGSAGVPSEPTGFGGIIQSSQVLLSWNANPASDNVAAYAVYRGNGTSTAFASCALVWSGDALAFADTNVNLVTGYTYYVVAINAVGDSLPSVGFNATTAGTNNGQVLQTGSVSNVPECDVDFGAQVLACSVVEITLSGAAPATNGEALRMGLRYGGADVATTYQWVLVQNTPGATTPAGSASDSAVTITPNMASAGQGLGTVTLQLGSGSATLKMFYEFAGSFSSGAFVGIVGSATLLGSIPGAPMGVSFKAASGNISLNYAIKGYQI